MKKDEKTKEISKDISFYFVDKGQRKGPFTIGEMQFLSITQDTLVWCNGMKKWDKAGNIVELDFLFIDVPPPIPVAHDLAQTQDVGIPTPLDVAVYKPQARENGVKLRRAIKIFFKEIAQTLKFTGIAIGITLLLSLAYYLIMKPEMVSEENQRQFNKEFQERRQSSPYIRMTFGDIYVKYLGSDHYDKHLHEFDDLYSINKFRISRLKEDVHSKSIICLIICAVLLIVGRYVLLFSKWLRGDVVTDDNILSPEEIQTSTQTEKEKIPTLTQTEKKEINIVITLTLVIMITISALVLLLA
jgi:hypothetical protein